MFGDMTVYVNVTYDGFVLKKIRKILSEVNVCVNVTYITVVLKENKENVW
jgi:hypothetical protein